VNSENICSKPANLVEVFQKHPLGGSEVPSSLFGEVTRPKKEKSLIGRCRKRGNHPYEDLAKLAVKPDMNYKYLNPHLEFWLHTENQI
jgi:hypothetical protein